jgi:catechol 2,3-dioxygenase-like lactoylglutathione lyase family enzyme
MQTWPADRAVTAVRFSRPTDRLDDVVAFYCGSLGLAEIGRFTDHDGWDGVMLGLPGSEYHLEFTSHVDGTPCPAPTAENLLVLYLAGEAAVAGEVERMTALGHAEVALDNPYWARHGGHAFEDPDGWRVVFMPPV